MCAITGLIQLTEAIDKNNFKDMNHWATHRGPDDEGFFFDESVALGHRRLSIIDLTPGGHQPMEKHGLVLIYNGEIYNYLEIRDELKALGHTFTSASDSEVILSAYHQWGEKAVERFNGMWSLAIYDKTSKQLFCSRDRFGIKPFYYYKDDRYFIFGSEIRQILAYKNFRRILNVEAVSKYLISSVVDDGDTTFFTGIKRLCGGHNLKVDVRSLKMDINPFYDVARVNTAYRPEDLRDILTDSVKLRLRSDVPVGSCLSGGLDSSLIVSLASRMPTKGQFKTFTAIPYDGRRDESEYVRKLAVDLKIEPHYLTPQKQDFQENLAEVISLQEEPFLSPSIFMQYFVMKEANKQGLKVLLDGQGADEIFLGYEKYFPSILTKIYGDDTKIAFTTLKDLIRHNDNVSPMFLLRQMAKKFLTNTLSPQAKAIKSITKPEFTGDNSYIAINKGATDITSYRHDDITDYNLPSLLRYEDKNSMHFSIETRLPYLDYRVVDIALKWPLKDLIKDGLAKSPLRTQFTDVLPAYISQRRSKFNFNAPENIWAKEQRELLKKSPSAERFFHVKRPIDGLSGNQAWKVLNLCLWHDKYFT